MRRPITFRVAPNGCHICTSHKPNDAGYPATRVGGRKGRQRTIGWVRYTAKYGEPAPGLVLRHTCDNPLCCNPDHLIPGTHAENVRDRVERGRSAKGERHGRAKLTTGKVRAIRVSDETDTALARRYGVDRALIAKIRARKIWTHVA